MTETPQFDFQAAPLAKGRDDRQSSHAILTSGGLDSAILLGNMLDSSTIVHPLYVRSGLTWEVAEESHLRRYLSALENPALRPLKILELPAKDLYGPHWSLTGDNVPDASTPDDAVFLPGRNILLLAKAVIWCHLHGVPSVALATLKSNPFPDATAAFFAAYEDLLNRSLGSQITILRPYSSLSKAGVMRLGRNLPLHWTFSCIHPANGRHCGGCNKCAERKAAFADANMRDDTEYDRGNHVPSKPRD